MNSRDLLKWSSGLLLVACATYACKKDQKAAAGNPCPPLANVAPTKIPGAARLANELDNQNDRRFNLLGVGYNDTIRSIVAAKCSTSGCHGAGVNGSGRNFDLTTYDKLKGSSSASRIASLKMPPSGSTKLTTTELASFATWVAAGSPLDNNAVQPTPTPTFSTSSGGSGATNNGLPGSTVPQVVAYDNRIKPMMDQYCISCHRTGATQPYLTTAQEVSAAIAKIMPSIRGTGGKNVMPPFNAPAQMPLDAKAVFEQWSLAGFPMVATGTNNGAAVPDCNKGSAAVGTPTPTSSSQVVTVTPTMTPTPFR